MKPEPDVIRRQRWEAVKARALRTLEKFDPDQPRDEEGKWTSGGGGGGGGNASSATSQAKPAAEAKPASASGRNLVSSAEHRQARANEIGQKFGLKPVEVRMDALSGDHAIGRGAGPGAIVLNEKHWTQEGLTKWGNEWDGFG